jgi:hypothetical protein
MDHFNEAAHAHLLSVGYTHLRVEAEFDDGDPENGPGVWGAPAYDVYTGYEEIVGIGSHGLASFVKRDIERERWEAEHLCHPDFDEEHH